MTFVWLAPYSWLLAFITNATVTLRVCFLLLPFLSPSIVLQTPGRQPTTWSYLLTHRGCGHQDVLTIQKMTTVWGCEVTMTTCLMMCHVRRPIHTLSVRKSYRREQRTNQCKLESRIYMKTVKNNISCTFTVALSFPINTFHTQCLKQLSYIFYDKCF